MEKTIWKFKIATVLIQSVEMPENARILCVKESDGQAYIWALVNPQEKTEKRMFQTFRDCERIECGHGGRREYISTYHVGTMALHVFEYTRN